METEENPDLEKVKELMEECEYEEAEKMIKPLFKKDPNNVEILDYLGEIYLNMGNYKASKKMLEKSINLKPNENADKYMDYAQVLDIPIQRVESYKKAIEIYINNLKMSFPGNNMNLMMNSINNQMNPMMNNMNNMNPMMNDMNNQMNPMMNNMMNNMNNNQMNPMMNNMNNNQMFMNNQMQMNNMNSQIMMNQMNAMGQMPMNVMAVNQSNFLGNMNNQFQNANLNNNFPSPTQDENLSLQFENTTQEVKSISVPCKINEVLSDVVSRYWSKLLVKDIPEAKYIFNAKNLNLTLTVAESGLNNDSIIRVVQTKGIKGA